MKISNSLLPLLLLSSSLLAQDLPDRGRLFVEEDQHGEFDASLKQRQETEAMSDQDRIIFPDENSFNGKLEKLSPEGGLSFSSPHANKPLLFRHDAFRELLLADTTKRNTYPFTEQIVLTNGDIIPGKLVALDAESLTVEGMFNSNLSLLRSQVQRMRVGILSQQLIYNGPAPLEAWKDMAETKWPIIDKGTGTLTMNGKGQLYQDVNLGDQFLIRFYLRWERDPYFRLYFGDEGEESNISDRYYIDINSGGLQIKREVKNGAPTWQSLIDISNQNEAFDDDMLFVDIRCNRATGLIQLYVDQRLLGQSNDTEKRTVGKGLRISQTGGAVMPTYLTSLEVYTWDANDQAHSLEKEPHGTTDTLIDLSGKRMSGDIKGLIPRVENEPAHFEFVSPYAEKTVKIARDQTSLIFFKNTPEASTTYPEPAYILRLQNQGKISATTFRIDEHQVILEHPILKTLTLPRDALLGIESLNPPLLP